MKKGLLLFALATLLPLGVSAQFHYQDGGNVDMLRPAVAKKAPRKEIIIPDVEGYKVYKADLHTHTFYSDGHVLPELRVREAHNEGLDILAITDHFENRKYANDMLAFLKGHVPEGEEHPRGPVSDKVDYNLPHKSAEKAAERMGIFLIKGIEISRDPAQYGHFNALFTTDNNTINDPDPEVAIRNARAQGAIIMHNHPGWRRSSLETHAFEDRIYSEGLIDGIEVMNNNEFYPKAIDRAINLGFFISSNTDIHGTIAEVYGDQIRDFTMIFANEISEQSIREALLDHRTVAYSYGTLAGEEKWLKPLFEACVDVEIVRTNKDSQVVRLVNKSSLPFVLKTKGGRESFLAPDSSANFTIRNKGLTLTVENMWCGADKKLSVTLMPQ
ncbi:MAG: histidinol-phosphatase, partial [Tidjanibacter sp.]|nr:histidinol-phosphatase [Tidjanibacter sp.]